MQKRQSGLQNEYSMHMALMHLTEKNSKAIDKGDYSLEIFIDFSDAFDAIIYQTKCTKNAISWHRRYCQGLIYLTVI